MLINLRNALMSGKRLPYDAEVEFLESTGTQWINTGITPTISDSTRIVADLSLTSINTSDNNIVFGSYAISPAIRQFAFVDTSAKARIAYVGAASGTVTVAAGTDYLFEAQFAPGGSYLNINGTRSSQNTSTTTALPSWPLSLFACRYEDSAISPSSMRLRSCKIYLNGVLVRDYIPVRKGTVGYLYDRVSGALFGNAGTGDFTCGSDVVPVEYIESHGTAYINTGVVPDNTTGAIVKFLVENTSSYNYVLGSRGTSSGRFYLYNNELSSKVRYGWGTLKTTNADILLNQPVEASLNYLNDRKYIYNNEQLGVLTDVDFSGNTYPMFLFDGNFAGAASSLTLIGKIYVGAISKGSTIVRSFRPVRVGTDATSWEGAMMDVLTRRVHRNAGTGAFTYGNDLKYPIPAA